MLPISHIVGISLLIMTLMAGGTVCLVQEKQAVPGCQAGTVPKVERRIRVPLSKNAATIIALDRSSDKGAVVCSLAGNKDSLSTGASCLNAATDRESPSTVCLASHQLRARAHLVVL